MASKKVSTNKRGGRQQDSVERATSRVEQIGAVVVMWFVPLSIFAYVAVKIAFAMGVEVPEWLVFFDFRRAAVLAAIVLLVVASTLVLAPVVFPRKSRRAGPWDGKTSPGQLPGN